MLTLFKIAYSDLETIFHVIARDPTEALGKVFDYKAKNNDSFKNIGSVKNIEIIADDNSYNINLLIP